MNHMLKTLRLLAACICLLPAASFCQVELVSNPWPTDPQGYKFYPDADVTYSSRAFRNDGTGIPGIPFKYTVKQYGGQGYHTHETAVVTVVTRHPPTFLASATGVTNANGIAETSLELNGYAGWYTVCAQFGDPTDIRKVLGERCVNNNTRYTTRSPTFGAAEVPLVRYPGGLQETFQQDVNMPQTMHVDSRHVSVSAPGLPGGSKVGVTQNQDGYTTRWVTPLAGAQLFTASSTYKSLTANDNNADLLDVTRASLPDGGVYDNDVTGVVPGAGGQILDWDTRVFEEHARGVEMDITIPYPQSRVNRMFEALYSAGCKPGINTPEGVRIPANPPDSYWGTQGAVHVTCSGGLLGTGLRGGRGVR